MNYESIAALLDELKSIYGWSSYSTHVEAGKLTIKVKGTGTAVAVFEPMVRHVSEQLGLEFKTIKVVKE